MRWQAELQNPTSRPELRAAPRRQLLLLAPSVKQGGGHTLIRNLSTSGLLLESDDEIPVGEQISVELPEAGSQAARVVWQKGRMHGCQFETPITNAALSAAQLRALPEESIFRQLDRERLEALPPIAKIAILTGITLSFWGAIALAIAYF